MLCLKSLKKRRGSSREGDLIRTWIEVLIWCKDELQSMSWMLMKQVICTSWLPVFTCWNDSCVPGGQPACLCANNYTQSQPNHSDGRWTHSVEKHTFTQAHMHQHAHGCTRTSMPPFTKSLQKNLIFWYVLRVIFPFKSPEFLLCLHQCKKPCPVVGEWTIPFTKHLSKVNHLNFELDLVTCDVWKVYDEIRPI